MTDKKDIFKERELTKELEEAVTKMHTIIVKVLLRNAEKFQHYGIGPEEASTAILASLSDSIINNFFINEIDETYLNKWVLDFYKSMLANYVKRHDLPLPEVSGELYTFQVSQKERVKNVE